MSTPEHSQGRNFPNQKFGWVLEPDGTWSLYSETGVKLISTTTSAVTIPSLPGGSISVTDGTTTVDPASVVDFTSNATVTRSGTTAEVAVSGGGSSPGAARVLGPFAFAYNDAAINNGKAFYTPTVGDVLLDAFIRVITNFDGTTPLADIGTFASSNFGVFGSSVAGAAVPLSSRDTGANWGSGTGVAGPVTPSGTNFNSVVGIQASAASGYSLAPAVFATADPLLLVVSQDGSKGGAAIGGTAGTGAVYIVVATPSLT